MRRQGRGRGGGRDRGRGRGTSVRRVYGGCRAQITPLELRASNAGLLLSVAALTTYLCSTRIPVVHGLTALFPRASVSGRGRGEEEEEKKRAE